mmetsp:Transcript_48085/g.128979  ORF Transcript_48085/g.128979 Transcript_48085/m.128979 type:complete len:223 (-) Transcript_48085:7-675(-)
MAGPSGTRIATRRFLCRMTPSKLQGWTSRSECSTTAPEFAKYFDKLHTHRENGGRPSQKLWSFDEGDWSCDSHKPLYTEDTFSNGHFCHDSNSTKNKEENKDTHLEMAESSTDLYECYNARSHSWHGGFGFGSRVDELRGKPYSGLNVFNVFHCTARLHREEPHRHDGHPHETRRCLCRLHPYRCDAFQRNVRGKAERRLCLGRGLHLMVEPPSPTRTGTRA